ncbi:MULTISPECIES: ESX-1 secretion-associated protein [unclassified Mycolicibacterium]|uniref:ESX-1 secretion-associated protein n=1 Tax=unclassified Mycolicibacterium TaxID=2636767 RepID=UPI0012DCF954|nr:MULTISPECIES: ESX-1 secretion-associated protein [unclassified Mycolicibacterium]MUL82865.1 ESX-1 secretion-associated protein [Mycolicibacterium sp. CBMA 329]MUL89200.1 ESX-1 secretion-associated protein [Mycolicibacterium sp. CBMA 331]MUL97767.1 ESX-1 secretion-associated protein [Mycolicibacterium sp. CBMA 334]MUM25120.1 ESX-1 secretion-associated protein [Mycolicibacterium sp. CBMA 295]MUM38716.1 ESX-1 secretion-associated protein [Mycolicibacterium sp. CBMA 247]
MAGDLRVATAHLYELSAKQGQAATSLTVATGVVDGVDSSVRLTHGPISSSTAAAVEAALNARRAAGTGMARVSQDLGDKLTRAASGYDRTDATMGGALNGTVR